jgi:hypothetical protein
VLLSTRLRAEEVADVSAEQGSGAGVFGGKTRGVYRGWSGQGPGEGAAARVSCRGE